MLVETQQTPADYGETIRLHFYLFIKGLGAPVGYLLIGKSFLPIQKRKKKKKKKKKISRRIRKILGGGKIATSLAF